MLVWLLACLSETTSSEDEGSCTERVWNSDADGDGFGGKESVLSCEAMSGFVERDGDCNDDNDHYDKCKLQSSDRPVVLSDRHGDDGLPAA